MFTMHQMLVPMIYIISTRSSLPHFVVGTVIICFTDKEADIQRLSN